jgi:hypothetical protein
MLQECDMDVVMNEAMTTRWLPTRVRGMIAGALLASGMTALAAPPQQRAAILLPPVKMEPGELPTLARGAMDDLPGSPAGSTPVTRRKSSNDNPAWLTGVDPNVIPASGLSPSRDRSDAKQPFFNSSQDLPPLTSPKLANGATTPAPNTPRPLDKPRMLPPGERLVPPLMTQPEPNIDPNLPFRGTASNGAPVMAGPPAYRWYGYGSVTPGSNQYAPNGQYPKGSSNWYGVTGATPGAFPVPVVNPYRTEPGNEPPSYVANPPVRTPMMEQPRSTVVPVPPAVGVRPNPGISPKPASSPVGIPAMPLIQSIGTDSPTPGLPPLPQPVGIPSMPSLPVAPKVEPVSTAPAKPIMGTPVLVTKPVPAAAPEPLPPALTNDPNWKPIPAGIPIPVLPPPDLFLEPGAKVVKNEITARGQMPDSNRDPAIMLIQGVCKGRADGVDVRWTASHKLTVCFEVRSQADAGKLVKDISARPELAPFAIDFCAVVK